MNHHHGTQLKQILTSAIFLIGILYSFQTCTTPGLLDNNGCVLPEDPIIPDDEKCLDYCKNNGICNIEFSKPVCSCDNSHYGITCSFTKENVVDSMNTYLTEIENHFSTLMSSNEKETIIKLRALSMLSLQKVSYFIEIVSSSTHETFINDIYSTINTAISSSSGDTYTCYFELLVFAFHVKVSLFKEKRLRNLDSATELKNLIELAKKVNEKAALLQSQKYEFLTDMTKYITFQRYKLIEGVTEYKASSLTENLPIFEFGTCSELPKTTPSDIIIVQTILNSDITAIREDSKTNPSDIIMISAIKNSAEHDIKKCPLSKAQLPISVKTFNEDLFKYYASKGINIYNPKDKAFTDSCFISKHFDFDLTQKYRRQCIFQGYTINSTSCTFNEYNLATNMLLFSCKSAGDEISYSLDSAQLPGDVDIDHIDNIPTLCGGDVENIAENIGFWIFLIMYIFIIFFDITLWIGKVRNIVGLNEIEMVNINGDSTNSVIKKSNDKSADSENRAIKSDDIHLSVQPSSRPFCSLLYSNFLSLHPLLSIFHETFLSPIIFTSWIFLYNVLNLFGFNALYFNETMLEDRIYDKHRDNFGYPMKTEFEKIMAAISTCIALNLVVRAISLVLYKDANIILEELASKKENSKEVKDYNFVLMIRRIIAGVFMLGLNIFFFYYCVVFCGMYVNAQYGWFYSGIWSFFWVWVVYAPLYILIITWIESYGNKICVYYMKRLFIF